MIQRLFAGAISAYHLASGASDGGGATHEGGRPDSEVAAIEEGVGASEDDPADVQPAAA